MNPRPPAPSPVAVAQPLDALFGLNGRAADGDAHGPLVVPFSELGRGDLPIVGQKCAGLGEALRAGLEIPAGFAVTTHVLDSFLRAAGPATQPSDADALRAALEASTIPHPLAHAVRSAYAQLSLEAIGGAGDTPVALRPSPAAPHAAPPRGRPHGAWLNVRGADSVVSALQRCWADRLERPAPLAVAVQQMVDCEAAGVAVPADVRTGDDSVVCVQASWGFGPSAADASGRPPGDRFVVEKASGAVLSRAIAPKPLQVAVAPNGQSELRQVPSHRREAPCLTNEEASRIAEAAGRLERHFGAPQEVEFAIVWRASARRIQVLQVRPHAPAARDGGRPPRPQANGSAHPTRA